jgi:hypothetical protein
LAIHLDHARFAWNLANTYADAVKSRDLLTAFVGLVACEDGDLAARCLTALEAALERGVSPEAS